MHGTTRGILAQGMIAGLAAQGALAATTTEVQLPFPANGPVRAYTIVEPEGWTPGGPAVVVVHGGTLSMRRILQPTAAESRWASLAEEFGFVVIAPNGFDESAQSGTGDSQTWNDIRPGKGATISDEDDVGFIAAVIDREAARLGIDRRAVCIAGPSNGGMMVYRMMVERPELFAAGCAFIANLPEAEIADPVSARPMMVMNGDADPLMPWTGGPVASVGAPVRSAFETIGYWRRVLGVEEGSGVSEVLPDLDLTEHARIVRTEYPDGTGGPAPFVFYRMVRAGHSTPVLAGDPQEELSPALGVRCRDVRGVDVAWEFFRARLPGPNPCAGDATRDGRTDIGDFVLLAARFGSVVRPGTWGDINSDGMVDAVDFVVLVGDFGCGQ